MFAFWDHPIMAFGVVLIGCCIGSFLNVCIYRIPRGLSVNEPKRSFCPSCQKTLPAWQNIPVMTWLLQQGKCRHCAAPIAARYLVVELLTGLLFFLSWKFLDPVSALGAMFLLTVLVTVSFIDAEHQVIPIRWTTATAILATVVAIARPSLLNLAGDTPMPTAIDGLKWSLIGWLSGFGLLWLVVQLGKLAFGRLRLEFDAAVSWQVKEGHEDNPQVHFLIDDEAHSWDDLFFRPSDRLELEGHGILLNGKRTKAKSLVIHREMIRIGDEDYPLEDIVSLQGKATRVVVPREAMGSGDPHLLGMIGAFIGWPGVIFTVAISSLYGIIGGLLGRVGLGRQVPFGPYLAMAAVTWIFGGWKWWKAYLETLGF